MQAIASVQVNAHTILTRVSVAEALSAHDACLASTSHLVAHQLQIRQLFLTFDSCASPACSRWSDVIQCLHTLDSTLCDLHGIQV